MSAFEKIATTPGARDRLRHEAAMLARARHPGVIGIVEFAELDGRTRLALARLTTTTLATAPPTDAGEALRLLAAVATTVADLHGIGIAHRRLQPDHVLVADARPLLCGFAEATGHATAADRALDDEALRSLVDLLASHAHRAGSGDTAHRALRRLAATSHEGSPLPAGELARLAGRAAERSERTWRSPRSPRRATPIASVPRDERSGLPASRFDRRRRLAAIAVAAAIACAVIGWPGNDGSGMQATPVEPPEPHTAVSVERSDAADAADPGSSPTGPTPTRPSSTDDRTPASTGVRVRAGGAEYEVGRTGDQVAVADWSCTGAPTAALLRPDTGEVFVFLALPDTGESITGHLVATITGARELLTDDLGGSCPPLTVRDVAGQLHRIGGS